MTKHKKTYYFYSVLLIFVLLVVFISACNEKKTPVPDVFIDFEISLNDPEFKDLNVTGGHVNVTGGVRGILIYRKSFDEFLAYDRACPYDPDCGYISSDKAGFIASDTVCCKSEFSLALNGAVTKGPAQFPLKNYSVYYNSTAKTIRVSN